jgi:hypothetical protein
MTGSKKPRRKALVTFLNKSQVRSVFEGKRIALVGSGPGVLDNPPGRIDGHDVVVRVNNYRLYPLSTGLRTDVFYSFFGSSIKKTARELKTDGVRLCMCKCPNALAIESPWHRKHDKMIGVDFRWIYLKRMEWWFCDTYVPSLEEFLYKFELLGKHIPTTGFAALLDLLMLHPAHVYITGFDFFRSGIHNVKDVWREKNNSDPIRHVPEVELAWLASHRGRGTTSLSFDPSLDQALATVRVPA